MLGCLDDGTNEESEVLSSIFSMLFIDLGHSKLIIFVILYKGKKINYKDFCKRFCKI